MRSSKVDDKSDRDIEGYEVASKKGTYMSVGISILQSSLFIKTGWTEVYNNS